MTFDEEFALLSAKCKSFIRAGHISTYSCTLKEMAELFRKNDRVYDQLRVLVVSFYIDLSGFGCASFIDRNLVEQLQTAIQLAFIDIAALERSYYEWIDSDMMPQHALGRKDCWYLLRLCAEGKIEQADYILTKI